MWFLAFAAHSQAPAKTPLAEQTVFSAEDNATQRPVPIPKSVMQVLAKDDDVLGTLAFRRLAAEELPAEWFTASEIHLGARAKADLIIMGTGPLRSANVNTFWIFRRTPGGYDCVLRAVTHTLKVLRMRSRGDRDILLMKAAAEKSHTARLKFNGRKYELHFDKWEPIR